MWEFIQFIYKKNYDIPPRIIDYIAVMDIVELCARGKSCKSIAKLLKFSYKYVRSVILEFLNFDGWDKDFETDFLLRYESLDGDYETFVSTVKSTTRLITGKEINIAYRICGRIRIMRKEIKQYVK